MLSLNCQKTVLHNLLDTDDLVLMSETIEAHRNILRKWRKASDSKDYLKLTLGKPK